MVIPFVSSRIVVLAQMPKIPSYDKGDWVKFKSFIRGPCVPFSVVRVERDERT